MFAGLCVSAIKDKLVQVRDSSPSLGGVKLAEEIVDESTEEMESKFM